MHPEMSSTKKKQESSFFWNIFKYIKSLFWWQFNDSVEICLDQHESESQLRVVDVWTDQTDISSLNSSVKSDETILSPTASPGIFGNPPAASIGHVLDSHHLNSMVYFVVSSTSRKHSTLVELPVEISAIDWDYHRSEHQHILQEIAAVTIVG